MFPLVWGKLCIWTARGFKMFAKRHYQADKSKNMSQFISSIFFLLSREGFFSRWAVFNACKNGKVCASSCSKAFLKSCSQSQEGIEPGEYSEAASVSAYLGACTCINPCRSKYLTGFFKWFFKEKPVCWAYSWNKWKMGKVHKTLQLHVQPLHQIFVYLLTLLLIYLF